MHIVCPHCQTVAASEHVNMQRLVAACPQCDEVFSFADALPPTVVSAPEAPRREPVTPRSVTIRTTPDGVEIRRRWLRASVVSTLLMGVLWCGFLVCWYVIISLVEDAPPIMKWIPIVHIVVGLGMLYVGLAGVFNSTVIRVTGGDLRVAHRPFPWRGHRRLTTDVVKQLAVESRRRSFRMFGTTQSPYQYLVRAHTTDQRVIELMVTDERDEARAIEHALERHLGIVDDG